MNRSVLLNVVGLTSRLIGRHTPRLLRHLESSARVTITPTLPAVTCTAQSTYLTGSQPSDHGIVANGWYDRSLAEVQFWKQSNHLVRGEKIWESLRRKQPGFTCAKLFWWYNMYSTADWSITPRPAYPADGRKVFDIYASPYSLRTEIKSDLGEFPFPGFWGPAAGRNTPQGPPDAATRWIAQSARWTEERHRPTLSLVYLPHLDYNLQRYGVLQSSAAAAPNTTPSSVDSNASLQPLIVPDLEAIDAIVGELLDFYRSRDVVPWILSEYGITNVTHPIHLNRIFRQCGWLAIKEELGLELLDAGASRVFAVADHQVAHVYVNDSSLMAEVGKQLASIPGIARVLGGEEKRRAGLDHPRSGDWIAVSQENAWFTYYYWLDDALAPDFARCVDIHRKPGYDPVELFTDPRLSPLALKARIGWRLLQKKLGFRMLMDVIPLDATLVRGSHGCRPSDRRDWPLLIGPKSAGLPEQLESWEIRDALLRAWSP